jgi:hypothetical protein
MFEKFILEFAEISRGALEFSRMAYYQLYITFYGKMKHADINLKQL